VKQTQSFGEESLEKRGFLKHPGTDARMILKLVLKQQAERVGTGFIWLRIGASGWLL
jgi:hypothetical protein